MHKMTPIESLIDTKYRLYAVTCLQKIAFRPDVITDQYLAELDACQMAADVLFELRKLIFVFDATDDIVAMYEMKMLEFASPIVDLMFCRLFTEAEWASIKEEIGKIHAMLKETNRTILMRMQKVCQQYKQPMPLHVLAIGETASSLYQILEHHSSTGMHSLTELNYFSFARALISVRIINPDIQKGLLAIQMGDYKSLMNAIGVFICPN